jgi:CRP/FNR family cyclic AMP-dependent transcriptional regulator
MDSMDTKAYHDLIAQYCAQNAVTRNFQKGAILITCSDQSDTVYFVLEGELKICITDEDGKELILNFISAGESFGELAVFTGEPRSADVIARTACKLLIISKQDYLLALQSHPELTMAALEYQARLVQKLTHQASSLALVDVFGRIIRLLKERGLDEVPNTVEGMTHQDIAATIGASREMVSKIMGDLKKAGHITLERRKITLLKAFPKSW